MAVALQAGFSRGLIEFRNSINTIGGYIFFPLVAIVVLYFLRDVTIAGSDSSVGSYAIPGIIALNAILSGLMGIASTLMQEKDDGTLLRAQCLPHGTLSYFVGKIVAQSSLALIAFLLVTTFAVVMLGGVQSEPAWQILSLLWIVPLGLAATLPIGVIFGAFLSRPRQLSFISLAMMAMTVVSGIFYPITTIPVFLQWLGLGFPLYWLGAGMRSALLPPTVNTEVLTGAWVPGATLAVLATWAVLGAIVAGVVLRRAGQRENGTRNH
ncbi:ABC transporter permease [Brevibacterium sp. FAM 24630]|uniref:ABC transporter permease n=1 Tax=Brevibacterium sp. FAM 24630 TaxID=3415680 RepID=UPI003C7ED26A